MPDNKRKRTRVSKTASTAAEMAKSMARSKRAVTVTPVDVNSEVPPLTEKEIRARREKKANSPYSTTTFGFNSRTAYSAGADISGSSQGNFYSPQLSTDFLEKPQNLRERRAWYRHFYAQNEFVGQAIDLHSTLPISKIKLDKPKLENQDYADYIYEFFVDMCQDMKLTSKTLLEISHEYWLIGNCVEAGSRVLTYDGYKKIEDVRPGDLVLTHKGRWRKVTATASRYAEDILSAKLWELPDRLNLTGEHPVEVLREESYSFIPFKDVKKGDFLRISYPEVVEDIEKKSLDQNKKLMWDDKGYSYNIEVKRGREKQAVTARKRLLRWLSSLESPQIVSRKNLADILGVRRSTLNNVIYQLHLETDAVFHRRIGAEGFGKGSRVEWLPFDGSGLSSLKEYTLKRTKYYKSPREIAINEDFSYLLGYWVSDGTCARDRNREGLWQIVFGKSSERQCQRVISILENMLGKGSLKIWNKRGMTIVKVKNPAFVEWWASQFGETSHGDNKKRIPGWFIDLPTEKLKHFLAGVIDSDGCVAQNGSPYVGVSLTSRILIDAIYTIGMKCGVVWSYSKQPGKVAKTPNGFSNCRETHTIHTGEEESCRVLVEYACKTYPREVIHSKPVYTKTDGTKRVSFKVREIEKKPGNLVYNLQVEEDHTFQVNKVSTHNCLIFAEDHDPYGSLEDHEKEGLKEVGKLTTKKLYENFKVIDKDPNYRGFRRLIVLPPDQVTIKKIPLSDDILVEFLPDPETRKALTGMQEGVVMSFDSRNPLESQRKIQDSLPDELVDKINMGGAVPLDTDPYTGSHVYHMARKKCQYETMGVSILERCINTLLLHDKLRQAQTSIASRHMTPIRIVWAEELSNNDVDNLREQVDLALVDPDFSIITNFQVNWEEMGSNGRLLELSSEYEHIENSLFAGLGVTRELLTGEGTYSGNRITLEVLNTQYLLFRELIIDYIENNLFKPVAKKKGFEIEDKFGRKKLIYPKVSFSRLAIRDNDAFFDQAFNMYNKGSLSVDVILDMMNIDPVTTRKKIEADLFTVNDPAFNQLMQNMYSSLGQVFAERFNADEKIAEYLRLQEKPMPEGEEGGADVGGLGGLGGSMGRFASTHDTRRQNALTKLMSLAMKNPDKLDNITKYFEGKI